MPKIKRTVGNWIQGGTEINDFVDKQNKARVKEGFCLNAKKRKINCFFLVFVYTEKMFHILYVMKLVDVTLKKSLILYFES